MLSSALYRVGVRGWMLHTTSLGFILVCLMLWQRAKTIDQDERGHAERRALYVGLWPPTFWLIGDSIERQEDRKRLAARLKDCRHQVTRRAGHPRRIDCLRTVQRGQSVKRR